MLKKISAPFASLTLTVILLGLSMVLIYVGTWAQVHMGLWDVQRKFFHSFFSWVELNYLLGAKPPSQRMPWYVGFPMPGGYTIGVLLLLNLLAAHSLRFKSTIKDLLLIIPLAAMVLGLYTWSFNPAPGWLALGIAGSGVFLLLVSLLHGMRTGVITIHLGLILLIIGQGITSGKQVESLMMIREGAYANFSEVTGSPSAELAVVERAPGNEADTHTVVSVVSTTPGTLIADSRLPFDIRLDEIYRNSAPTEPSSRPGVPTFTSQSKLRKGEVTFTVREAPSSTGVESAVDVPGAIVTVLSKGDHKEIGKMVMRAWGYDSAFTGVPTPPLTHAITTAGGRTYELSLRFKRLHKPYTVTLNKFSFDRYPGTNTPLNFSSDVVLNDPTHHETHKAVIKMNTPLRYRGETLYQANWDKTDERGTVLQVVENPGYLVPYMAILIAGFGLVDHFTMVLAAFLLRRALTVREVFVGHLAILGLLVGAFGAYHVWDYIGILGFAGILGLYIIGLAARHIMTRSSHAEKMAIRDAEIAKAVSARNKSPKGSSAKVSTVASETRRVELAPKRRWSTARFLFPAGIALCAIIIIAMVGKPRPAGGSDSINTFATLPTSHQGRIQPMDTVARSALKLLRGKESALVTEIKEGKSVDRSVAPAVWLLDLLAGKSNAHDYKVFVVDHPDLRTLIGVGEKEKYVSFNQLRPKLDDLFAQWKELSDSNIDPKDYKEYQKGLNGLVERVELYWRMGSLESWYIIPPVENRMGDPKRRMEWSSFGGIQLGNPEEGVTLARQARQFVEALYETPDNKTRRMGDASMSAGRWLMDAAFYPSRAGDDRLIRITNAELRQRLNLDEIGKTREMFSLNEVVRDKAAVQNVLLSAEKESDAALPAAIRNLARQLGIYKSLSEAGANSDLRKAIPPSAMEFVRMLGAYRSNDTIGFVEALSEYARLVQPPSTPGKYDANPAKIRFEAWYNQFDPFFLAMILYVFVFTLTALSWLGWREPLARAGFWLLIVTVLLHTFGVISRIYISGRPPVTNLTSSALFIGWAVPVLGIFIQLIFRNGIGLVAAAVIGAPCLLIADRLSITDGDSMKVLQAVLDTNVWLATHVITITLGYAATFLAWILGVCYVVMGLFTTQLRKAPGMDDAAGFGTSNGRVLARMIYGTTCFAIVMSFVGTILGGIWADQSWGRFWGWDPKENGAALIVLANALVLHARWAGLVKDRGIAVLAIFGGIVTTWSWFGVNMLGVGLHSYGFMDRALFWILLFVISQALLMIAAGVPLSAWRSFKNAPGDEPLGTGRTS